MASHINLRSKRDQRVKPRRMRLWARPGSGPGVLAGHGRLFYCHEARVGGPDETSMPGSIRSASADTDGDCATGLRGMSRAIFVC
jgi:hypothetical protein